MRGMMPLVLCTMLMTMSPSLGRAQKIHVGEPAPDFTVPSLDGKTTYRLSDFRGHRVLIFNWASW
jgi:hypothetical protein